MRECRIASAEAELAERNRRIDNREAELEADTLLVSERSDLERRERRLSELERRVPERMRELDEREADFELRRASLEAEIELREERLEARERELEALEQRLGQKESELVSYVAQVQGELGRRELQPWR